MITWVFIVVRVLYFQSARVRETITVYVIEYVHFEIVEESAYFSQSPFTLESLAKRLGNNMKSFLDYDTSVGRGGWNMYMQLRVRLDVQQPLLRLKKILKQGDDFFQMGEENAVYEWPKTIQAKTRIVSRKQSVLWCREMQQESTVRLGEIFQERMNIVCTGGRNLRIEIEFHFFSKQFHVNLTTTTKGVRFGDSNAVITVGSL
ncbi:hypothetical protein Golax_018756 [Gossypium laxum]|uniref:Uncharacterized protein n=1 Tax=Gossypium laxum TaxID=34288 RepID=A0A7J8Z608_9ROSI|nr:hypothetical protein [Gossypium laxum]